MIHIWYLRMTLGLKITPHSRTDKKRNTGKTVICPPSVAPEVLSQVDGWRADAEGKAQQCSETKKLVDMISFKTMSSTSQVFISCLIYFQSKFLPNWNSHWFQTTGPQVAQQHLPAFCFYYNVNQASRLCTHLFSEDVKGHITKMWFVHFAVGLFGR